MKALLILMLAGSLTLAGVSAANDNPANLSPEQMAEFQRLLPGVELTPELIRMMMEVSLNADLPVNERMRAIARLSGIDKLPEGQRMKRVICIWDLVGRNGPVFGAAMEARAQALEFGIELDMVPYTNEGVMVEEFKSGRCDAALMSGLRARQFNKFTGSIDAIGAVPDRDHLRTLFQVATHPRNAGRMVSGQYVVLGVFPAGAAFVFVNDREINTLSKAAGRKVAVLDYDPMQARMIAGVGATPVATDITRAPGMFNNGVVDILAAPLLAYEVLELYKGMSPNGGIINYPLAQITMQLIGRIDKFPNEAAQLIRESSFEQYDRITAMVMQEEAKVPERWWIPIPESDMREYDTMMQQARISLRDMDYYDAEMLTLQRRIRCRFAPDRGECVNPVE
ncbi:MAG: hypothetical protein CVV10_05195 [Gammaproteobacteria bacterium HGW-Gammaproteobacteria-14]|nr:MAG: hypothetical protein CVV10_05195 [Gammaproteobacteria bacterium HGW-Gammaproteobacteria-14]